MRSLELESLNDGRTTIDEGTILRFATRALESAPDYFSGTLGRSGIDLPNLTTIGIKMGEKDETEKIIDDTENPYDFPLRTLLHTDRMVIYSRRNRTAAPVSLYQIFRDVDDTSVLAQLGKSGRPTITISPKGLVGFLTSVERLDAQTKVLIAEFYVRVNVWHEYLHLLFSRPMIIPDRLKTACAKRMTAIIDRILSSLPEINYVIALSDGSSMFTRSDLIKIIQSTKPSEDASTRTYTTVNEGAKFFLLTRHPPLDQEVTIGAFGLGLNESLTEGFALMLLRQSLNERGWIPRDVKRRIIQSFAVDEGTFFESILFFYNRSPRQLMEAIYFGTLYQQICSSLSDQEIENVVRALEMGEAISTQGEIFKKILRSKQLSREERRKKR